MTPRLDGRRAWLTHLRRLDDALLYYDPKGLVVFIHFPPPLRPSLTPGTKSKDKRVPSQQDDKGIESLYGTSLG